MAVEQREGTLLGGKFRLDRRLGEGGMGIVWKATNTATGRKVAIKMLRDATTTDPHVRRRFAREARAASTVQHPNVVEILDVLELEDQTPAMVMELLEGESLGQRLRARGKFALADLARIMVPAVGAIGTAHAAGVVHRDLKPDNIFLSRGHEDVEVVKVLDFGIAKMTHETEAGQSAALTGTGAMLGTPYYMAPEQLFSDETLDYRCDIWALGVILYECLAGVRPARGDNFADIVKIIATQAIVPFAQVARDVPPEISDLVTRMLSFDKDKRPQSLREVRDILRHYTDAMASTFGEPILKPVKQSRDADESGESRGLRRADVALLLADEPPSGPSTAATLDARDSLEAILEEQQLDTIAGAPVGFTTPPATKKRSSVVTYVLGGVAVIAIAGLSAKVALTTAATPVATAAPPAVSIVPPPIATPSITPEPPASVAVAVAVASASASTRPLAKRPPAIKAVAPTASTPTSTPGGLVEKPPF